jgi:hypothetical protein
MSNDPFKNFFNHVGSSCYDNEKILYSKLVNESIGINGVRCEYYIIDYNTNYDKLMGEDSDRTMVRKFSFMSYFTLPPEDMLLSINGIENTDRFKMWVSKEHFGISSTTQPDDFNQITKGSESTYEPKVGDIVNSLSNDTLYEILTIEDSPEENQFLQTKNVWEFTVRVYRDLHYNTNDDVSETAVASMSAISAFTDQDDYLEINDYIDDTKTDIIITSADDIANGISKPNDPFGEW